MSIRTFCLGLFSASLLAGFSSSAQAQIPVTDVGAIFQLVTEVQTLSQQLQTAEQELQQAQQAYQSITGSRGMQNVASGTNWNYLPSDWTTLQNTLNGAGGTYSALAANVQAATSANAVLSPAQLAALSPDERAAIQAQRQSAAYLQALSQQALSTTSTRFASIQQLINAIPTTTDQKGILELQARIGTEQGLLANEQTKLQVLYQAAQADQAAAVQRTREQAIASVGSLRTLPAMGL
jgi:type IV secretion system protein VirB5